jgi:hypothetical protein
MKKERILGQLKKVTPETFVAAGKFAPRGVVAGQVLGGALGGGLGAAAGSGAASVLRKRKASKDDHAIEIPRVFYVAVTDSDVVLF